MMVINGKHTCGPQASFSRNQSIQHRIRLASCRRATAAGIYQHLRCFLLPDRRYRWMSINSIKYSKFLGIWSEWVADKPCNDTCMKFVFMENHEIPHFRRILWKSDDEQKVSVHEIRMRLCVSIRWNKKNLFNVKMDTYRIPLSDMKSLQTKLIITSFLTEIK